MIDIKEVNADNAESYVLSLSSLIESTIKLPIEAKDSYKQQWSTEKLITQIGKWLFLIATDENNNTIGVILGTPIEGGVGTIIWVLVDNTSQQKRVGSQLFEIAKEWYKNKGAHKIKLTVPDRETVEFYTKQGMVLEGEHLNHWWNADFWSMGKNL